MSESKKQSAEGSREVLHEALASDTDARAAAVLPATGSEDARHVRGSIELPELEKRLAPGDRDYLPEETTEWVISVTFDKPTVEWGDDHFFSVWTSTDPGYFLPERIAAGEVQVQNLVFGFPVTRCCRPTEVAEAMIRSANYARSRLGGELLDRNGKLFFPDTFLREVRDAASGLAREGFEPGSAPALHLF